jgi:hypothetical protein
METEIIEGQVVFRNLMGKAAFLKIKVSVSSPPDGATQGPDAVCQLYFRQDTLGEEGFARVRGILLFEVVRVEVGPEQQLRTGSPVRPVTRFVD